MNATLIKAVVAAIAVLGLAWWLLVFGRRRPGRLLFLLGTASFAATALTHVFETLRLFPAMGWGMPGTPGHYFDLASALLGIGLFAAGLVVAPKVCPRRHRLR
jgi:hypothetical protein